MGLADFLISKRQQAILAPLFLHPDKDYSVRDLIRIGGMGHGAIQNMLAEMYEAGVIVDHREGNQRRFQANRDFPLYAELRSICVKSFGLQERLKAALEPFGELVQVAFVFGSFAKGTENAASDVDLFVVGDVDLFDLNAALSQVELDVGRPVQPNLYTPDEFERALGDSVVRSILDGPRIMVTANGPAAQRLSELAEDRDRQGSRPR